MWHLLASYQALSSRSSCLQCFKYVTQGWHPCDFMYLIYPIITISKVPLYIETKGGSELGAYYNGNEIC